MGLEGGKSLSLQSQVSIYLILFFRFILLFYSANPESWWVSRLLTPNPKTARNSQIEKEEGRQRAGSLEKMGVRMSLLSWTRWHKGRTCHCVRLSPVGPTGPFTACGPVADTISWSGIRAIPHSADGKLSASELAHGLSTITQQVQGKCRMRASKAQRQTAWPHHSVHPGRGNWVKTIKRENVIENWDADSGLRSALSLISWGRDIGCHV